jgi:2-octaprenyl-6-methoxyphenol hydroxylase
VTSIESSCDVLIAGGGLVGSVLAVALRAIPLRAVVVEAGDPRKLEQPSFDSRATALAHGSRRILEQLGVWEAITAQAEPIRSIHIGERGRFGAARIEAAEEDVEALGYTIENRVLGRALWQRLDADPGFHCLAPATLTSVDHDADDVVAVVERDGESARIRARLMIAADGAQSAVRSRIGVTAREDDYEQQAIVFNCTTELPLDSRAYERFTSSGPLALLPLVGARAAAIWTLDRAAAEKRLADDDAAFRRALQAAFGYRLGRFVRIGARASYRLSRLRAEAVVGRRVALVGNAAVSVHPVAGQGFNLALRDVAALAEVIADEVIAAGRAADVGATRVLERYRDWRRDDQRVVAGFTHGLIRGFGATLPGLGAARGLGLIAFDLLPGAKRWLARRTMGRAGRLPRLARGLDLT